MSENKLINGTFTGTIKTGEINMNPESQLDRVEKKMDRILELLEGKELSTSVVLDGKVVGELIEKKL
jgi:hypothetical protein